MPKLICAPCIFISLAFGRLVLSAATRFCDLVTVNEPVNAQLWSDLVMVMGSMVMVDERVTV